MKEYFEILKNVGLFSGIEQGELASVLACLGAETAAVKKGEYVLAAGSPVDFVGIVLTGRLHIVREDINGERALIAGLAPGDFFGETLCCAGVAESPVGVLADTDAGIMRLGIRQILETCSKSCPFHTKLIENMLRMLARKNLQLQARMDFLEKKTIRARLMSYFESVAMKQGREFVVPFNREELADFLCVDRSALSRELGKLKSEGIIEYRKNRFALL